MESCNVALVLICAMGLTMAHVSLGEDSHCLDLHNAARAEVGVGPLTWNKTLAAYAQKEANQRTDCQLIDSDSPYGENQFWGSSPDFTASDAVKEWVAEKQYYDYKSNTCKDGQICGHYTQVVWRDSVRVGCARGICKNNGGVIVICNYDPSGNYMGEKPY